MTTKPKAEERSPLTYYCEQCRQKHNWPKSPVIAHNQQCWTCDRVVVCYMMLSSGIPAPKETKHAGREKKA